MKRISFLFSALLFILNCSAFTVVIDAGHGGHDPGAVGAYSKEKNLTLRHALLVGDMLQSKHPDIKVIYTRDKDVFIDLNRRARIANAANADLFISIHVNAARNRKAVGLETFTLGTSRDKATMEAVMLENSVILLEDDYKKKYEGFDPNSVDSYIMFEFMKNLSNKQSFRIAELVQNNLIANTGRRNRGVKQAGLLVLRATTMPSILIELGFISNRAEEKTLQIKANQIKMAEAIYDGVITYKNEIEKKVGFSNKSESITGDSTTTTKKADPAILDSIATTPVNKDEYIFTVQIAVLSKLEETNDPIFKGIPNIEVIEDEGQYRYTCGKTNDVNQIRDLKEYIRLHFPNAFILCYKNGVREDTREVLIKLNKATKKRQIVPDSTNFADSSYIFKVQLAVLSKLEKKTDPIFKGIPNIEVIKDGEKYRYTCGNTNDINKITALQKKIRYHFPNAFIVCYKDGKRENTRSVLIKLNKQK